MSIEYSNCIMYGKEFPSFDAACDYLYKEGLLTDSEYTKAMDYGGIDNIDCICKNSYTDDGVVIGQIFTASELFDFSKNLLSKFTNYTDTKLGAGCRIHEFVRVW